jgi:hypothetical protein
MVELIFEFLGQNFRRTRKFEKSQITKKIIYRINEHLITFKKCLRT